MPPIEIKHLEPEQRASLIMEFTQKNRQESLVGAYRGEQKAGLPPLKFTIEAWNELLPLYFRTNDSIQYTGALYFVLRNVGYSISDIGKVLDIGNNRESIMERGRRTVERNRLLMQTWADLEKIVKP